LSPDHASAGKHVIKILHTADIHLDSPLKSLALRDPDLQGRVRAASRASLARLVDTAIAENVAAVLIAGDLYDGAERGARTAAFLAGQMERLREAGIRVFAIKGNHDAENPLSGEASLPDNVHVFGARGGKVALVQGVWIHGVSFAGRHAPESLLPRFDAPVPGAVNIAMLHTSLSGAGGHDAYAPCALGDLTGAGFDYWALGHVHRRRVHAEAPWVVMPGMPQGRDMGEAGPKSAMLLTVGETITVETVATSVLEFMPLDVDVSQVDDVDTLRATLRHATRAATERLEADSGVIRARLTGETPLRWSLLRDRDFWEETAAAYARETDALWLERLVLDLPPGQTRGAGAVDELAALMEAIRAEPGFAAAGREAVEAVLGELPTHRRAALMPDEETTEALVARLAEEGAETITARLRGAGEP
jgi:DNA repair exonuclease SbcCD nuclease subunit